MKTQHQLLATRFIFVFFFSAFFSLFPVSLFSVSIFSNSANAEEFHNQWNSVVINRSVLTDLVSDTHCFKQDSETQQPHTFLGCVAALDVLVKVSFQSPQVELLPRDYVLSNRAVSRQFLASFGPWAVVLMNSPEEQLRQLGRALTPTNQKDLLLQRQREKREALLALFQAEKRLAPSQRTSFSQTLSYYWERTGIVKNSASDRELITTALNRFIQERYDFYSKVVGDSRRSSNEASQRRLNSNSSLVESTLFSGAQGARIGALRLSHFSFQDLDLVVKAELESLLDQNIESLVLDLRDNPGGSLEEMAKVAGLFIGPNQLLATLEYFDGRPPFLLVTPEDAQQLTQLPMVILMNSETKSAAESLAIAFRDLDRAWLLGQRSYGKGVGQNYVEEEAKFLAGTQGLIWTKTLFRNISPQGHYFQGYGIEPDFSVRVFPATRGMLAPAAYREIEENPFAFYNQNLTPPPNSTSDLEARQVQAAALSPCLNASEGLAQRLWTPMQESHYGGYYNILRALDLAQCLVSASTPL